MADVSMVAAANTNGNAGKNRVFVCAAPVDGLKFFQLPHPRSGDATQFASATDGTLLGVNRLADASHPHSWLLAGAERVEQDGSLYVATPVDPLFVLLQRASAAAATSRRSPTSSAPTRPTTRAAARSRPTSSRCRGCSSGCASSATSTTSTTS